ncbi:MAG: ATP-binding protein [Clostridiales Family XIII bacterium]|jgi:AAA+ ATPase superfamily predicted ATPase|nr:ATP-binding protein [Clostridiales Family XIII bacterium]
MAQFIDRGEDLAFLQSEYDRPDASLVILYGRRRVGKTSLLSEFGKDKHMLYFLATEESEAANRRQFKDLVAAYTGNELLKNTVPDNWEIIFNTLTQYESDQKKLIVLDEFQYIGKSNPAFPSVFQKIWESLKNRNVMVVLCGSLISLMEAQTLSYDSPLYGRRTGQIKLKPIAFRHYREFYGGKSRRELIEYYSVTGGVPKYIELFREERDIWTAIEKHVLSTRSFLYEEPVFLLRSEVSEIGSYFSLIRAIADGNRKMGAIASVMGVKQTGLTKYLRTLIDLDIIEREVPVTEDRPDRNKRGLYRIKDNFIDFWFKFIYPERSSIETGHAGQVMSKLRAGFVDRHVSYIYEDVCRQRLWQLAAKGSLPRRFNKVGRWWDGNLEIDIVATDGAGTDIVFGECKYTNEPMDIDIYHKLLEKKAAARWNEASRREYFAFFSIGGYTARMRELAAQKEDVGLFE